MRIEFIGAAHEVTGSCHYLKIGDKHILVDCGMEQGADIYENQDIPVNAAAIDYVFVTHAHIDHSGSAAAVVCKTDSVDRFLPQMQQHNSVISC